MHPIQALRNVSPRRSNRPNHPSQRILTNKGRGVCGSLSAAPSEPGKGKWLRECEVGGFFWEVLKD